MLDIEAALGSRYSISQKRDLLIPDRRFCRLNLTEVVAAAKQHLLELDPESDFAVLPSWPKASYFPDKAKPFFSAFFKGIGEGVNRLEHLQIDWQIQQEGFVSRHRYVCKKTSNSILVEMMFFNTKKNTQLNDIGKIFRECRPDVHLIVLCGDRVNGTSFTNENAQRQVNKAIKKAAKEGKNVMIIASRLGQRSFSIPSLSTVYLCYDNGSESANRQKLARALTADTETKVGWIISCSFDPTTDDKLLPEQIATAKNLRKTKGGSFADNLKYVHRTDNIFELTKDGLVVEETDAWYNHAYDEGMITRVLGAMSNPYLVKGKLREMMLVATGWTPPDKDSTDTDTGDTFNDKKPKKSTQQRDKTDEEIERDEITKFRAVLTMLYELFPRMQIGTGKSQVIEILNDIQNNPDHASWFFKRISMPVEAVFLAIEDGVITEEDIEASLR
jgi:hypothetical protein